ncbi:UDP-N-acetylmuramate--L-alanine ligase [Tichowtungia aerotolerans]|uniref:Mur ligase N-terminal catalytic domain-containing protein n=1 Tax=Tichowtungia aerotolerans TaxID=2697043 RepID=A0A6P1M5Q2_9BACT|nr:Mur ligase domain-containing protein [Tichowtungia aerotolerans]QHI67934.1 hypothetical protein GT409_00220 [Tichowtungia aerotolerans]
MRIHVIGIGGCGMNGVAQLAAHAGYRVSGSDRATGLDIFQTLEKQGIDIVPQDGSGILKDTDFVVYSTAIEQGNPDLEKAQSLGIPLLHRSEMLAKLCKGNEVIAIAGTAGKSTVTGLLGHIFQCMEKDPTVYCGAAINNFGSSVRFGSKGGPWIIEVDESDKSFLHFYPAHAIITNIAEDHFELPELRKLFTQFEEQVAGTLIKQPERFECPSPLIGRHNIENVNNALTLCKALGLDMQKCIEAIASFKGIERRLERHGDYVIDDFAHSPIKIEAALEAVSEVWPSFNAVWRPHGFTPLFQGLNGFTAAFATEKAQRAFILPVYYAGGTVNKKITSEQFVEKLQAAGVPAEFVPDFQCLEKRLLEDGRPVLLMGARDPELPRVARQLAKKL